MEPVQFSGFRKTTILIMVLPVLKLVWSVALLVPPAKILFISLKAETILAFYSNGPFPDISPLLEYCFSTDRFEDAFVLLYFAFQFWFATYCVTHATRILNAAENLWFGLFPEGIDVPVAVFLCSTNLAVHISFCIWGRVVHVFWINLVMMFLSEIFLASTIVKSVIDQEIVIHQAVDDMFWVILQERIRMMEAMEHEKQSRQIMAN